MCTAAHRARWSARIGYKAVGRYVTVPPHGSAPSAMASNCSHRWSRFSLLVEERHDIRGLFNRDKRVRPVYLIEVDVTGLQAPQRVFDLPQQPVRVSLRITSPSRHSSPAFVARTTLSRWRMRRPLILQVKRAQCSATAHGPLGSFVLGTLAGWPACKKC
jgi:hypothetical protein